MEDVIQKSGNASGPTPVGSLADVITMQGDSVGLRSTLQPFMVELK
jgi:hypothetical protein